jgi:hypothetical protein
MTYKYAKKLSLEVWRYLAEHPEIKAKRLLPAALFSKIVNLYCECPLCEVFRDRCYEGCPLYPANYTCIAPGEPYYRWLNAKRKAGRKKAAEKIVRLIEAWKGEE